MTCCSVVAGPSETRMAEAAVTMLLERVENPDVPPEKRVFSGVLREGSSVTR